MKNTENTKAKSRLSSLKPSKRRLIQLYAALLFNANLKGFANGRIYKGPLKNICTPGLNCYSCPGASGSCPLGALQNSLAAADKTVPFYVVGIILLYGILLGRWICGFLCPFGLIQELLHKIPTPKLKKGRVTRILSYLKYVILVIFVFIIPLLYMLRDFPLPAFCKYICPAGTLEGAMGLLSNKFNESYLSMLGPLFTWKFLLMVSFLVAAIFIYRVFCRFFCPLGALYGIFNKISVFGIKLDRPRCTDCGLCVSKCKMDIKHVGDHECIGCGECIDVCPTKAIRWKGTKPVLAPNEIEAMNDEERSDYIEQSARNAKKNKIIQTVVGIVMAVVLAGALIYYNFVDKVDDVPQSDPTVGYEIGNLCPSLDLELYRTDGEIFNANNTRGKITVINFWGTWCGPCKEELPEFNEIATEYKDKVTVVAIHSDLDKENALAYIKENFPNSDMLFAQDEAGEKYYSMLGGRDTFPMTVILDEDGVIVAHYVKKLSYAELQSVIEQEISD